MGLVLSFQHVFQTAPTHKPSDSEVADAVHQTALCRGATTLHVQDIGFESKLLAHVCHDAVGVDQS